MQFMSRDGHFYSRWVDPQLKNLHRLISRLIPKDSTVIDGCCGTGQLALMMAGHCKRVVGVDISAKMIDYAKSRAAHLRNIKFICEDLVQAAKSFKTNEFEFATLSMALHEMPKEHRQPVLTAISRIARRVIVVDFPQSMPFNWAGLRNRLIEFLTVFIDWSTEHFFNFLEFRQEGGVENIVNNCNIANESRSRAVLDIDRVRYIDGKSIGLYYISTGSDMSPARREADTEVVPEPPTPQAPVKSTPKLVARL